MEQLYSLFGRYGLAAILLLIFLEYGCFPVSSEIILPCSGFLAALQGIPFPVLVIASTIAGLAGTSITYVIGRAGGSPLLERLMKRFPSFEKPILASYRKFGDRGAIAVFATRLLPLCRTYIGFVAGAMKYPLIAYLIFSALGICIWNSLLLCLGYYFYPYRERFFSYFDQYKKIILIIGSICLILYILYLIAGKRKSEKPPVQ